MHISLSLVDKMHKDEDWETTVKGTIIGASVACYLIAGVMVYFLYQHPAIDVKLASFLSATCVLLLLMAVIVVFFVEAGILLDIAVISLFIMFVVRSAFLEAPITTSTGEFER